MPVRSIKPSRNKYGRLATQMRALRTQLGLSTEEAARRLGISHNALGNIERGYRGVSCALLIRIATVYSTTTDSLLGLSGPVRSEESSLTLAAKELP